MKLDFDSIKLPTDEELALIQKARIARRRNPCGREKSLQNTTRLSDWLRRCDKAGIPYVPAEFSPPILISEIEAIADHKGGAPSLAAALEWGFGRQHPHTMWRWEECAPCEIKASCGIEFIPLAMLTVDDPRFYDIIYEVNRDTTAIAIRPIVRSLKLNGYPVEFRCYVDSDGGVAVSNYYPQISLPDTFMPLAVAAGDMAKKMFSLVGEAYTADFLITEQTRLLFLEGGPAWGMGAHPCCFNPEKLEAPRILLAPEEGAITT